MHKENILLKINEIVNKVLAPLIESPEEEAEASYSGEYPPGGFPTYPSAGGKPAYAPDSEGIPPVIIVGGEKYVWDNEKAIKWYAQGPEGDEIQPQNHPWQKLEVPINEYPGLSARVKAWRESEAARAAAWSTPARHGWEIDAEDAAEEAARQAAEGGEDEKQEATPEQSTGEIYGKTITPTMTVYKQPDGRFRIEYTDDPLGRKSFRADFDSEINRLFGYSGWSEYKKRNWEDLTRSEKPTVHPIHVAYGLEEFINNFDINQYSAVGVPANKSSALNEGWFLPVLLGGAGLAWLADEFDIDPEDLDIFGILDSDDPKTLSGEEAEDRTATTRWFKDVVDTTNDVAETAINYVAGDESKEAEESEDPERKKSMATMGALKLLAESMGRRKDYFGFGTLSGVLKHAIYNPPEGLNNKKVINDFWNRLSPLLNSKIKSFSSIEIPVMKLDGTYWKPNKISSEFSLNSNSALKIKVSEILQNSSLLKEEKEVQLKYFLLPRRWRRGLAFTQSEIIFARRIGANINAKVSLAPDVFQHPIGMPSSTQPAVRVGHPAGASGWWQKLKPEQKKNRVDPKEVYDYLISNGVSDIHAKGMLLNMYVESKFNPGAINPGSKAIGLFQYLGSRKENLFKFYVGKGKDINTFNSDWKTQVDYALTERSTKKYLSKIFSSVEQAAKWFTKYWEIPQGDNKDKADSYADSYYNKAMKANVLGSLTSKEFPGAPLLPTSQATGEKKVLVFGHSQAGKFGYGGAFKKALETNGVSANRVAHVGAKDDELLNLLKDEPNVERYSHVVLMIAGNTLKHMAGPQNSMIRYLLSNGIPAGNIYVSAPPTNTARDDAGKVSREEQKLRKQRNTGTENVARSLGVNFIQTIVSGDAPDWGKPLSYHLSHRSPKGIALARRIADKIATFQGSSYSSQLGLAYGGAVSLPVKKEDPVHGYILGDLRSSGDVHAKYNENKVIADGASMNKPIIALIHMMKYGTDQSVNKKAMSKKELGWLLAYTNGDHSNYMNSMISWKLSDKHLKKSAARSLKKTRQPTIGKISDKTASEYLQKLGLPDMGVRYYNNKQTPEQYFRFMRLIHDKKRVRDLGIEKEVSIIKNHMMRTGVGAPYGVDRESEKWGDVADKLKSEGLQITSIYGKGGLIKSGIHYAFVVNDRYLIVIYVDRKKLRNTRPWLISRIGEILKTVMPAGQVRESKDLESIFNLIEEVQKNELAKNKIQQKNR
jgi:hypothetical protein